MLSEKELLPQAEIEKLTENIQSHKLVLGRKQANKIDKNCEGETK